MNLAARCRQAVWDLNQAENWGLPREALEKLCERVSRFVSPDISPAELTRIIHNYFQDGPRYEAMLQPDSIEGERDWEAIRRSFAGLAASYGVAPAEVEDMVQEAWYKATKGLGSFAFRSRLSVWLRSIIAHTCHDWYRRNRSGMDDASLDGLEQAGGPLPDPSAESPEEVILERERLLWLEAGLQRLLSQRDLQILRYTFGQPAGDGGDGPPGEWNDQRIAGEVGLAPGSVATTRRRILKRLRDNPDFRHLIWSTPAPTLGGDVFKPPVRAASALPSAVGKDLAANAAAPTPATTPATSGTPVWALLAPAGALPALRDEHAAIYDPVNQRMVVYSGLDSSTGRTGLGDVQALSLGSAATWSSIIPTGSSPVGRYNHAAIYDAVNQRMVIFGGATSNSQINDILFNDVWALSLGSTPTWSRITPSGPRPPARYLHSAMYDPVSQHMVIFGGVASDGSYLNDVWTLLMDGSSWSHVAFTGDQPTPRYGHTAIYDSVNQCMIIFGGRDSSLVVGQYGGEQNDVWALSLDGAVAPTWTLLTPAGEPPAIRYQHAAIYDEAGRRMIVFGGFRWLPANFNDVWALSLEGAIPHWTQLRPHGLAPVARRTPKAIYDAANQRMIVFAGFSEGCNNDAWDLSLSGGTPPTLGLSQSRPATPPGGSKPRRRIRGRSSPTESQCPQGHMGYTSSGM